MDALIVGLGSIGTRHLNNLYALDVKDISAFRERNLSVPSSIPDTVSLYSDFDEALNKNPKIIIIANPTSMHIDYSQKALESNCHLYIEKPISDSMDGVEQLLKLEKKTNRIIQVGCQLRFHPHLLKIKQWIDSGILGNIHSVFADVGEYLPGWHPWEDYKKSYASRKDQGGGVILTMIHDLDYLHWIFGPLTMEKAIGGKRSPLEINVEDTALISLSGKKQIPIHLRMDYWRKTPVRTLNIISDNAEVLWDYHKCMLLLKFNDNKVKEYKLDKSWNRNDLFLEIMKNFLNSIKGSETVKSSLSDGYEVLKIALTAKKQIGLNL